MLFKNFRKYTISKFNRRNITILSSNSNREYLFSGGALNYLEEVVSKHKEHHKQLLSDRITNTTFKTI